MEEFIKNFEISPKIKIDSIGGSMEYFETSQRAKINAIVDNFVMKDGKKFKFIGISDYLIRGTCVEVKLFKENKNAKSGVQHRCDLHIYAPKDDGIINYSLFNYHLKRTVYKGSVDKTYIEGKI